MNLWRIATATRSYHADDLSGAGAAINPGRWNDHGQAVVYSSPTIALAVLETAAHINDGGLPLNRYLVRIEVPPRVWKDRIELVAGDLPVTWDAIPAGIASVQTGAAWLVAQESAILLVPSVIVPEEPVALINPAHPDAAKLRASVVRPFAYNRLFRDAG